MLKQAFASVSDIRKNVGAVFKKADQADNVLLLNRNQPKYVLISYGRFLGLMEQLDSRSGITSHSDVDGDLPLDDEMEAMADYEKNKKTKPWAAVKKKL